MKKHIAILTGGRSAEREIAVHSAETVMGLLGRYEVEVFDFPDGIDEFLKRRDEFDCVIPVFHGVGGEDGTAQGFLRTLGIPFLFSDVTACAVGMDKALAKTVVAKAGVGTASWVVVEKGNEIHRDSISVPCVVKPLDGGSTQGISIVKSVDEIEKALKAAFEFSERVLVEDYVVGDEFTVGVINEGNETVALPVIQIIAPNGFYDHVAKYSATPAEKVCPAKIDNGLRDRLQSAAVMAHRSVGARHLSRVDFIVDKTGEIWFLEINIIPGQSVLFPKAVAASGRDYGDVLAGWIEGVCEEFQSKKETEFVY